MKKYVSVALATAMIASMGVTAFAKSSQYPYDVKDVTFISKTDNGDDEVYFQLKLKKGNVDAFIVDDAKKANGDVANKTAALKAEKDAYEAAKAQIAAISAGDFVLSNGPTTESVNKAAKDAVDALGLNAEYAGKVKAAVTGLNESSNADAVVNAIKAASTKVKTAAETAHTPAEALDKDYDKAVALRAAGFATVTGTHDAGTDQGKTALTTKIKTDLNTAGITDAGRQTIIADAIVAQLTGPDYTNIAASDVETAVGKVKTGAAAEAKADAAAKKAAKDTAVTEDGKIQALTKAGVTMPAAGQVDTESMKNALMGKIADDKYEAEIVKMVLSDVKASYATAAEAEAAVKAAATKVIDAHNKVVDGQIAGLGKATYVAYDEIEDIDDLKVSLKLTAGEKYVANYHIDEIDDKGAAHDGNYAIVLELNDNYTTNKQKIKGTVTLKNKTKKLEEMDFSFNRDIKKVDVQGKGNSGDYIDPTTGKPVKEMTFDGQDAYINLVQFNDKYNVAKFTKDVENIELEDNNGFYFDVKASDQGKLNLTYDNVAIKSVAKIAPVDADLTFFNFYGYPTFDFTGTVTLTPEEDDVEYFIYKVDKDGKISKVNAKLNADGDAYEFKTRTLGCYVMSDMELDVDGMNADEQKPADKPEDGATTAPEAGKSNPGTGC